MKRKTYVGLISAGVLLMAAIGGGSHGTDTKNLSSSKTNSNAQVKSTETQSAPKAKPICDGTAVTTACTVDGVTYTSYVYHEAVPEKSHVETSTTYEKKLTGYCTLCNDGSYSPSCATGRGACSYHGGVQEWNAPEYASVPVTNSKTIVDAPAQAAYFDKVAVQ